MKRFIKPALISALSLAVLLVIFAYGRTMNKTDLEIVIHIDEELVLESVFGESPTFAIWLEDPGTGKTHTVYATRRVATGDWEGKKDVPGALPVWTGTYRAEQSRKAHKAENVMEDLAITGATPLPGYFRSRVRLAPGSHWICWIEMNLAGDFNESYPRFDPVTRVEDEFAMGQPALLYRVELEVEKDLSAVPQLAGMSLFGEDGQVSIEPLKGITTATGVFDEISLSVRRPKPRIIKKAYREIY